MAEYQNPDPNGAYSEVFEDASADVRAPQTIHHIRANSSIMKLKKILGECSSVPWPIDLPGAAWDVG
jgi:hypothetical protein